MIILEGEPSSTRPPMGRAMEAGIIFTQPEVTVPRQRLLVEQPQEQLFLMLG